MTWSEGYVANVGYTHGFYRELTPAVQIFALLSRSIESSFDPENFTYCELGCGQGFSTNLLAAAHPGGQFHATDFNPSHIAGARKLAKDAGTQNVRFYADSFEDFGKRDLPEFDVIALHGIYSWVSDENRRHIVNFVARKLKVGGIVYISYNCQPGWAAAIPLRDLMLQFVGNPNEPILPRIEAALAKVQAIFDADSAYARANPALKDRLDRIKTQPRNYLAHEYFNRDWTIFYHTEVARELSGAKLDFAASAHILDHIDNLNLTASQQTMIQQTTDPGQRELLRDFFTNQQFRRDLFVMGSLPLARRSRNDRIADIRFILSALPADIPRKFNSTAGSIDMKPEIFDPVISAFAPGPKTIRQLLQSHDTKHLGFQVLLEAVTVLTGAGHLEPCLNAASDAKRSQRTSIFNKALMERARDSGELGFLASPLTGGGITVDRITQLFLLARSQKKEDPSAFVWEILSSRGEHLIHDGVTLQTAEENLSRLRNLYDAFTTRLPVLQQLGIA